MFPDNAGRGPPAVLQCPTAPGNGSVWSGYGATAYILRAADRGNVLVIGLTGAIGTGKSEAAAILGGLGAAVVDADREGHAAYAPGTEGWRKVVDLVGKEVVATDGSIDRRVLAQHIFNDRDLRAKLDKVLHPLIRRRIEERLLALQNADTETVVVQVPLLFQAGWHDLADVVWAVTATPEVTVERLTQRRGLTLNEAERRIAAQGPQEAFTGQAAVVIENNGSLDELREKVQEHWAERLQSKG